MTEEQLAWRKSSRCESNACVEVAFAEHVIWMRDSKDASGPALSITKGGWNAFLHGVRANEFGAN